MNWLEWCCAPFFKKQKLNADVSTVHIVPTPGGWVVRNPPVEIPSLVSCTLTEIISDTVLDTSSIEHLRQNESECFTAVTFRTMGAVG